MPNTPLAATRAIWPVAVILLDILRHHTRYLVPPLACSHLCSRSPNPLKGKMKVHNKWSTVHLNVHVHVPCRIGICARVCVSDLEYLCVCVGTCLHVCTRFGMCMCVRKRYGAFMITCARASCAAEDVCVHVCARVRGGKPSLTCARLNFIARRSSRPWL